MPKQAYALRPGAPQNLVISWIARPLKNISIELDGQSIGVIRDLDELLEGKRFLLPDGSVLKIQMVRRPFERELQVLRNGKPLPGSPSHPAQKLLSVYNGIFFWGGVNLFFGFATMLYRSEVAPAVIDGFTAVIIGVALLVFGLSVRNQRVPLSLILASFLIVFEFVVPLAYRLFFGLPVDPNTVLAILFITYWMVVITRQGLQSIRELETLERQTD